MLGIVFFALLITTNIRKFANSNSKNISLASISIMSQAIAENGNPIGKYCGTDACEKSCGIPPYVYTAHGHYWHCKWKDTAGTCEGSQCNKACDAMCVDL